MAFLYGRTVCLNTKNACFRPGQKQDLRFSPIHGNITVAGQGRNDDTLKVLGHQASLALTDPVLHDDVHATFGDGSLALFRRTHGHGFAFVSAFHVGLAYMWPAIPVRPAARGSTDYTLNHFLPTEFALGARQLAALPVDGVVGARAVLSNEALVDVGIWAAAGKGTALVLVNWSPSPVRGLNLTLQFECDFEKAALAGGGAVAASTTAAGWKAFVFELDVADALVLR